MSAGRDVRPLRRGDLSALAKSSEIRSNGEVTRRITQLSLKGCTNENGTSSLGLRIRDEF